MLNGCCLCLSCGSHILGCLYEYGIVRGLTVLQKSLASTVAVTAMVFLLVIASSVFGQLMAFSGSSTAVVDWAITMEGGALFKLMLMFGTLLLLGMFMDQISILLLTIPIFFPLAASLGFDPIWFGIIVLLNRYHQYRCRH